jgi:SAM-dependent methyltransferase
MNTLNDSSAIFSYHRSMMALHGNEGTAALGWKDAHSQTVRFKALAKIADLNNCSVLDAGCGHGDLFSFLQLLYPDVQYTGIEQIPEMLETATQRYGYSSKASFLPGNFITGQIPAADYVLASGSLNYRSSDPDFIFKAIRKLYDSCAQGLGFNLLKQINSNGFIVAYDKHQIFNYCRTLSEKVVLSDDYSDEDFTVMLYR